MIYPLDYWDLITSTARPVSARSVSDRGARRAGVDLRPGYQVVRQCLRIDAARSDDGPGIRTEVEPAHTRRAMLTNAESNIKMGTLYLSDKISEFGDVHLALASYNAGERAVRRWVAEQAGCQRTGRVHRRHPVSGNTELREEDPRDGQKTIDASTAGNQDQPLDIG